MPVSATISDCSSALSATPLGKQSPLAMMRVAEVDGSNSRTRPLQECSRMSSSAASNVPCSRGDSRVDASVNRILPSRGDHRRRRRSGSDRAADGVGQHTMLPIGLHGEQAAQRIGDDQPAVRVEVEAERPPAGRPRTSRCAMPSAFMRSTAPDSAPVYSLPSGPNAMCSGPTSGATEIRRSSRQALVAGVGADVAGELRGLPGHRLDRHGPERAGR